MKLFKDKSLQFRLSVQMALLAILPILVVSWLARNIFIENIRSENIKHAGQIADAKHDQLVMLLTKANVRTSSFLSSLGTKCVSNSGKLNQPCATQLILTYLTSEGATGADLHRVGSSEKLSVGASVTQNDKTITFQAGQLAEFSGTGPENNRTFFISVTDLSKGLQLETLYPSTILAPIFEHPSPDMETFLADGEGYFVTQARYPSTQGHSHPISARPMQLCLSGKSSEVLDLDYRGAPIIHGFHFIPEFGSACIMAHIDQAEAFAPATMFAKKLSMAIVAFTLLIVWVTLYMARSVAKPIVSLTDGLIKSESRLRLLLDSAAEAIYGIDIQGNCTFCNPSCLQLLGYGHADELVGKNMHELIHHKHSDGTHFSVEDCKIYQAFQKGEPVRVDDEVFWRVDGTSFPVEYWSHPQLHDGVAVGAVVTFLDITERTLAHEKLLTLSRAVENSPASVVITNLNGAIEYVNKKFTAVTGYSEQEAIGQNPRILGSGIHSKKFYQEFWATLLSGNEWHGEIYNRKKNGEIYVEHASISPIRDDKGAITYFVAVKEDITERKRIEEELQRSMAAAEAANRAKSDFLANMSHEIRTPMNAIIGLSHLCLQTELSAKQFDYLQKVHNSAKSLLGVINDILDFSKIEVGKMDIENTSFELESVMGNMATIVSAKAEEKGLEFSIEMSPDAPSRLVGDPLRLGQVLINIMGNAIKFTEKGEVAVLTEVEEDAADHIVLRFTVKDTGVGLTQEQIGKLFQAFTQADATTTRKFGGTGLGLSISKSLVTLMGGKIWVESVPGEGSKFIFTARFQKAAEQDENRYLPETDLRGLHVLVADNNQSSRRLLELLLKSFTFNVATVANGVEALQAIEKADQDGAPYDMIVLDWKMPQMDGIELARNVRRMAGLSKMPKILLVSAYGQSEMLRHLEGKVVDGLLTKPILKSELFDATIEIFGRGKAKGRKSALTALLHPDLVAKISGAYLLLAEDNEVNQQVARELLEKAGVTVAIAENGEEALAMIAQEKFDGVLMDMQMPVMDGLTATREIRKNPQFARLPIIALTANALASDREQCLAAGMNDHIAKPFDPAKMMAILAKWITPAQPTAHSTAAKAKTAQPEALPDLPGVKVAEGVRRMGDSVASYCTILHKFRTGQQNIIAEIRAALAAKDQEKAERLAHTLKGLSGTLGAEVLQHKTTELENGIRDGKNARIELSLPIVEAEFNKLLTAIDIALQSRPMENGEEVADTNVSINLEELAGLIRKAKVQLEEFDSSVEDSVAKIHRLVSSDAAMKKTLASIERRINSYDYEKGLVELTVWAKSLNISREG